MTPGEALSPREEMFYLMLDFFKGDQAKTRLWFRTPNPLIGGIAPKDFMVLRPVKALSFVKQLLQDNAPPGMRARRLVEGGK